MEEGLESRSVASDFFEGFLERLFFGIFILKFRGPPEEAKEAAGEVQS